MQALLAVALGALFAAAAWAGGAPAGRATTTTGPGREALPPAPKSHPGHHAGHGHGHDD